MPGGNPRERGRRRVIHHLIPQCLDRLGNAGRDLPVILLLGSRGSGKTRLLEEVRQGCAGSAALPFAWIDLSRSGYSRPWQVAADLAATLGSTHWRQFGTLKFPRFTLGAMVIQENGVDLTDPAKARTDVAALLKDRGRLDAKARVVGDLLQQLAGAGIAAPGLGPGIDVAGRLITAALGSRRATQLLFRTGMSWYGNRGHGPTGDGFGALVDLNRLEREGGAAGRRDVDLALCEAFLADLRAGFADQNSPCNCLAIMDNVNHPAGEGFLNALVGARASASVAQDSADPLLVVAARRTRLSPGHYWGQPWQTASAGSTVQPARTPDETGYEDWAGHRATTTRPESWWYPVLLTDLRPEEVLREAARSRPRELSRLAPFVQRLTGGHASAMAAVLEVLASLPRTPTQLELLGLLEMSRDPGPVDGPAAAPEVFADGQLAGVLVDVQAWRRDLVTWSAARDVESAISAGIGQMTIGTPLDLRDDLARNLWLVPGDPTARTIALHPWLRRLLLRQLALRPEADAWNWENVNTRLRDHHRTRGELTRVCYHELALGQLRPAVDLLDESIDSVRPEDWIHMFDEITAAPNRLPAGVLPEDQFEDLLTRENSGGEEWGTRRNTILHMVAAHWICSDPLRDPDATLSRHVAAGYANLGRSASRGSSRFYQEEEEYRRFGPL